MILINSATITIRQENGELWTATCSVGYQSKSATARDVSEAVGLAVILQSGLTENALREQLRLGRAWGDFLAYAGDVWGLPRPIAQEEKSPRPDGKMSRTSWAYSGDTRIFGQ